ncbi:1-aminocyclopropane-1-carboxylate oxidase 5-like [Andrographis paniculata]|uniref:1-aminocyclopropane-1-carboxylate oxidase 5-like n=1 Tax=Andrographis paniculata TaxID=175694 RepID=UPI0021E89A67|nr:1-aminocyclopropane-1-carboxylate oxidase 5-like [Andrographis paniculata]
MAIPVIDFSKLQGESEERAKTLAEIHACCVHWGFFQLINHGIPEELLEMVKKVTSECFKLEREALFEEAMQQQQLLLQNGAADENNNSYSFDWEDVFLLSDDNVDQWPSKTSAFRETMKEFRGELKKLAIKVMEAMDENLGLPKGYINKAFSEDAAFFGTKVSHYPPCPAPEKMIGLRAHTDAGGVILLFQDDEVKGLQILKDGAWMDVQPLKNAIVINTGDQIEVLSNGLYKSVWHRVLALPDGNRRSIASFYNPSHNAIIQPAQQLLSLREEVEDEGDSVKIKYPKFLFGDYMSVYAHQKFSPKEPRFQAVKTLN